MEQEEASPRVGVLETQVNSLVSMITEMKALLEASHARRPAIPDPNNPAHPSSSNTTDKGQPEDAHLVPEATQTPHVNPQPKVSPVVINLEKEERGKSAVKTEEGAKRLAKIEECSSGQGYELAGFDKISPFAKIEVPPDYKEPEFVGKYNGTGCPRAHLKYYLRKMAHYSDYVPLLMNTFQESLAGIALAWFIELDLEDYDGWEDLAEDFLHRYKFNTATAPTREDLLRTVKGKNEHIRTYAQRWRALATQVKPSIPEDELVDLFLKALPYEYFDKLNTSGCRTFVHPIKVAERLEWAMRERKAPEVPARRRYALRKEGGAGVDIAFVPNPPKPKRFSNSNPT
ncbi:uncharacterized protein LOC125314475 [Rhodamnia argentea]|uniref:Uncharacterized protein LOC125314475 n=1 Tax=Rhodamnia argentea TaxID=178133 RepID=A0ABM3H871_9MYRT|nr:uncharacterized protein LOC125314475 [Rhodamnia argentea]